MKDDILKISRHTLIYTVGTIINRAIGFIMLPVYTRYLSPADYGTIELLTMTLDIISLIMGTGVSATVFKYYFEYESSIEKKEVISTSIILLTSLWLITSIGGLFFSNKLSLIIFKHEENGYYFKLLFIIYFLQSSMITIPFMFIRAIENSKLFVYLNLIKLVMQVSFNILFVVRLKMGILGILYSTLLADFILGLYLIVFTFRRVGFRFSISKCQKMVKFGYFFVFVSLGSFIITYSDRYFLNVFSELKTVGIYALAYKFGFLLGYLTIGPFMQIWEPYRFEIVKKDYALPFFKRVFLYFNIAVISFSLLISIFVKDVLVIMAAPSYLEAYKIVPIIIIAYIFQAWTYYCNIGIYIKEKSKYLALAYIISAVSVIILNFILIPKYGGYGAAFATVGAFFIRFILTLIFSQKFYYVDYDWKKQLSLLISAIFIYLISRFMEMSKLAISFSINTILILLFVIVVYFLFLDGSEKNFIKKTIKNSIASIKALASYRL